MYLINPIQQLGSKLLVFKNCQRFDFTFKDPTEALADLCAHACRQVPYYRQRFAATGLTRPDSLDIKRWQYVPILTKEDLKTHFEELKNEDMSFRKWKQNSTGGSTGRPTRFIQDATYDLHKTKALHFYFRNILGIDYSQVRKLILWGSPRDILKQKETMKSRVANWLQNQIILNCFHISEKELYFYVKTMQRFQPQLIRGYARGLYELAKYILRKNIKLPAPHFVISQASNLTETMRRTMVEAFGCPVRNFYGGREVSAMAGEGDDGLLHIFSFWNHLEILDKNNCPVKEGEEGRVVVTNLYNYAMPLIRYEIGDCAVLGPISDRYGYRHATLKEVTGRLIENFVRRDGTVIPGNFFTHFIGVVFNDGSIDKFQVIQKDFEQIKISLVSPQKLAAELIDKIETNVKRVLGDACQIEWEYLQDIPKTPEGKVFITRSLVKRT